jgi:hypothetical protein
MPRRPKLVSQFLERIHRNAFAEHPEIIRDIVRGRNGIYALYDGDELYYVGLAKDLRWRLKHHLKDHHQSSWDRFSVYITIGDQHLRELESLAIRITLAAGNKQKGRFAGADNLERALDRNLKAKHKRERDTLFGRPIKEEPHDKSAKQRTRSIRGRYNGKIVRARWQRDGTVRYKGKIYSSLSAAASKATGSATNGRWFWHIERSPGDWVRVKKA